jgi:phosphocarrier protein HPr
LDEPADDHLVRLLKITNKRGLHARASAKFVQCVEQFDAEVTVAKDGFEVGATSIMGLMMLAAANGSEIQIAAAGRQARQALDALEALVAGKFGESD